MATILIIDDDRQTLEHIVEIVSSCGHTPVPTVYPSCLCEILEQKPVDLILLDVYMPEIDGVTLLKQLKADTTYQSIPVIMLTSESDETLLAECLKAGAVDFINKPANEVALQARIQSALNVRKAMAQLESMNEQLKMNQEQLVQSEKMAALGQLVAGISHEINTPVGVGVTAASHFADATRKMVADFERQTARREDLEKYFSTAAQACDLILTNLRRTSALIKSFKMVSADQTSQEKRRFNVRKYLETIITSLEPKLKKSPHRVTLDCPENIEVESCPGAFAQVITNLIINSLTHAYEDGDKGEITISISSDREGLTIVYQDDGKGMPETVLQQIFNPFFTTRRGAGGTGLGLHIVYNIVHQRLNGKIKCKSVEGGGTTFTIALGKRSLND